MLMRTLKGRPPMSDAFGRGGRLWLAELELPVDERETVDGCLRQIDFLNADIAILERGIAEHALHSDHRDARAGCARAAASLSSIAGAAGARRQGQCDRSGLVLDPDRNVGFGFGFAQGYNAQAAVNEQQIVLAAEISNTSTDFSQLDPMVTATLEELKRAGTST